MPDASDAFVSERVPLAPLSTLGIGGDARWFVRASEPAVVARAHAWALNHGVPLFVLGGGSNLVIADEGVGGLVLQVSLRGISFDDMRVTAAAGEPWDGVVAAAVSRGLSGIECLSGIPGSVGGTPIQNVGAYGQEVADTITSVMAFDTSSTQMVTLSVADCEFAYRMSRFKARDAGRFIVCGVSFELRGEASAALYPDVTRHLEQAGISKPSVADLREAVLTIRRRKGMVVDPEDPNSRSVGSFFMNPIVPNTSREHVSSLAGEQAPAYVLDDARVKLPAAWLIERAGFHKGFEDGAVGISTKHPLAVVNRGGATARDVLRLAARIKRQVGERFGIWLRPEPIFVGFTGNQEVAFLQNDF